VRLRRRLGEGPRFRRETGLKAAVTLRLSDAHVKAPSCAGEVAEWLYGARSEGVCTGNRTVGSNPTFTASTSQRERAAFPGIVRRLNQRFALRRLAVRSKNGAGRRYVECGHADLPETVVHRRARRLGLCACAGAERRCRSSRARDAGVAASG